MTQDLSSRTNWQPSRSSFGLKNTIAAIALGASVVAGCSPYVYSSDVQTFSGQMSSVDASYKANAADMATEKQLAEELTWTRDKKVMVIGPGCITTMNSMRCDIVEADAVPSAVAAGPSTSPTHAASSAPKTGATTSNTDACQVSPSATTAVPSAPATSSLTPLQRQAVMTALDDYIAGLAAITKAQDRADFDSAASKVSAAIGSLAQSAAVASGVGAAAAPGIGTLANDSSDAALWVVGQELDYQRLQELRSATQQACEPIHILSTALAAVLDEQRGDRLDGLYALLVLRVQEINTARTAKNVSDQTYGTAIDTAETAAQAYETVRETSPDATAAALSKSHDALVVAVRSNTGEFSALVSSLEAFSQSAEQLAAAASAKPASTKPASTKS